MSESQENIEAKLIAYVEGDLDLAGRAEIEQHLKGNPTHRKLLDELRRTRDFVRELPRAKAPPELVETLQGQLERSALLDNIGIEGGPMQMRPNRWPQVISIAAVVLLAVGLGAVVFIALPRGDDRSTIARTETDGPSATAPVALSTRPTVPSVSTITVVPPEATLAAAAPVADAIPTTLPAAGTLALPTPVTIAAVPTTVPAATPEVIAMAPRVEPPAAARAAEAAIAPGAARELAMAADGGAGAASTPAAPTTNVPLIASAEELRRTDALYVVVNSADPSVVNSRVASYLASNRIAYENVLPNPAVATVAPADDAAKRDVDANAQVGEAQQRMAKSSPAAPNYNSNYAEYQTNQQQLQQQQQFAMSPQQQLQLRAPQGRVAQQFIAKQMTRQQVTELQSAMAETDVQLIEPPVADATPALQAGDEVDVTVNELVGPGVEKTNRARVNADGNITMPMVEPVRAAGLTPSGLSDAVARRYRDASLIERPTVNVALVPRAGATTAPAIMPGATTSPSTSTTDAAPSTTAPAAANDAPVDVVIVVQTAAPALLPSAAMVPTTLPATLPTTAPTTQTVTTTRPATTSPVQPATAPTTVPATPLPTTAPTMLPTP